MLLTSREFTRYSPPSWKNESIILQNHMRLSRLGHCTLSHLWCTLTFPPLSSVAREKVFMVWNHHERTKVNVFAENTTQMACLSSRPAPGLGGLLICPVSGASELHRVAGGGDAPHLLNEGAGLVVAAARGCCAPRAWGPAPAPPLAPFDG